MGELAFASCEKLHNQSLFLSESVSPTRTTCFKFKFTHLHFSLSFNSRLFSIPAAPQTLVVFLFRRRRVMDTHTASNSFTTVWKRIENALCLSMYKGSECKNSDVLTFPCHSHLIYLFVKVYLKVLMRQIDSILNIIHFLLLFVFCQIRFAFRGDKMILCIFMIYCWEHLEAASHQLVHY